jgi:hypothetical protein
MRRYSILILALAVFIFGAADACGGGGTSRQIPDPPTLQTISAGTSSDISLTWTAIADADSYDVYRGTSPGGELEIYGQTHSLAYTDTGEYLWQHLVAGTTYYYEVTSVNTAGESVRSNELNVTAAVPGNCVTSIGSTNTFQVNGVIGQPNSSTASAPLFTLYGDGGLSSYNVSVDGVVIPGAFYSQGTGVVCVQTPPTSDGSHTISAVELKPNPTKPVTPLTYLIDTVPPPAPSAPTLVGVNAGKIALTGTAPADDFQVQAFSGTKLLGGAAVISGSWSITTTAQAAGTYSIVAVGVDKAGNKSAPSAALSVVVS